MDLKIVVLATLAALSLCSGCVLRRVNIEEVSPPIEHISHQSQKLSIFDRNSDSEHSVSLGEIMFILERTTFGNESIALIPPAGLKDFPALDTWKITHKYRDSYIYTSPSYYRGQIGIMADVEGRLSNGGLLFQVSGGKTGRTWRVTSKASGLAFYHPIKETDIWGLRYGGKRGDGTEFQIIDRKNPNVTEVIQSIFILDGDLGRGFLVKGVMIVSAP